MPLQRKKGRSYRKLLVLGGVELFSLALSHVGLRQSKTNFTTSFVVFANIELYSKTSTAIMFISLSFGWMEDRGVLKNDHGPPQPRTFMDSLSVRNECKPKNANGSCD